VSIRRLSRLEVGEGIEKAQANLADDVAAMVGDK
jgi:translation elongation factor EF-Ts